MDFDLSPKATELSGRTWDFNREEIFLTETVCSTYTDQATGRTCRRGTRGDESPRTSATRRS